MRDSDVYNAVGIDIRNGQPLLDYAKLVQYGVFQDTKHSYVKIDWETFRSRVPAEAVNGKDLRAMNSENWRSYVPESAFRQYDRRIAAEPKADPGKYAFRAGTDIEACYIVEYLRFGTNICFLRHLDTGWRCFQASIGPEVPEMARILMALLPDLTEENIAKYLEQGLGYATYDRLLSPTECGAVFGAMPEYHDDERDQYGQERAWVDISIYGGERIRACYWKNGRWVPCAEHPDIQTLYNVMSVAARTGIADR